MSACTHESKIKIKQIKINNKNKFFSVHGVSAIAASWSQDLEKDLASQQCDGISIS